MHQCDREHAKADGDKQAGSGKADGAERFRAIGPDRNHGQPYHTGKADQFWNALCERPGIDRDLRYAQPPCTFACYEEQNQIYY